MIRIFIVILFLIPFGTHGQGCRSCNSLEKAMEKPEIGLSLRLNNKELKELLLDISKLINLQYLYLSDTYITKLPSSITSLSKLKNLELFNRPLDSLFKAVEIF